MFDFPAFDVAIGLIFVYIVLALVCSVVNEAIATATGLRARFLETGLMNLLSGAASDTAAGRATARDFYRHPLVQGMIKPRSRSDPEDDTTDEEPAPRRRGLLGKSPYPSYIPSRTFVIAITDMAHDASAKLQEQDPAKADELRQKLRHVDDELEYGLAAIPNKRLSEALLALHRSAGGDAVRFQRATEEWFDDAMERVGGWYKRRVHVILAVIAAVVVVLLNADTLSTGSVLWRDDAVRAAVVKEATDTARGNLDDVKLEQAVQKLDLPLGWNLSFGDEATQVPNDPISWIQKLVGLLLTIGAIQLGAPFWFDLLSKIVRVRGTGAPPPAADAVRHGEGEETRRGPVTTPAAATAPPASPPPPGSPATQT